MIIGIDDQLNPIGIDRDKFGDNYDKFRRNFVQKIENYIGKTILNRLSMDIEEYKGKDCFVVECEAHNGDESTFTYVQSLKDKNVKEMFVRTEGKVVKLEGKDLADFILQNKKP